MLAVSIMNILSKKCRGIAGDGKVDSIHIDQAATWPSEDWMKGSSWFYWDLAKVKRIWNKSGLFFAFMELKNHVRFTFNSILMPFFKKNPVEYIDTSLPSNASVGSNEKMALERDAEIALLAEQHKAAEEAIEAAHSASLEAMKEAKAAEMRDVQYTSMLFRWFGRAVMAMSTVILI